MFIYKMTQANHGSEFEWLGLEPNDYEPSEYRTCSVFEPLLYSISWWVRYSDIIRKADLVC